MPPTSDKHVASLALKVNGAPVDPAIANDVLEVRVKDSLSLPASATVRLNDAQHAYVDNALFTPGNPLEVSMGDPEATTGTPVFKGEIVSLEPEFSEQGVTMIIRALDKSHRLQRRRDVRTFQDVGANDIIQTLTGEVGLAGSASSSPIRYKFFQQSGETGARVDRQARARSRLPLLRQRRPVRVPPGRRSRRRDHRGRVRQPAAELPAPADDRPAAGRGQRRRMGPGGEGDHQRQRIHR